MGHHLLLKFVLYGFRVPQDPLFMNKQNSDRIYRVFCFSNAIQMLNTKIDTLELKIIKIIKINKIENKNKVAERFRP